jgi:glycosyltransferase involved in cell wall biosynthesis
MLSRSQLATGSRMTLVSVVMPTHNHALYIGDAIASVLSQSHGNLELIVVDNYSTDNTREIVEQIDDGRVRYCQYDNEGIIAASRNQAVSIATGDVVAFLDSDDTWSADKLSTQLPHLDTNGVVAVATNFTPIGETRFCRRHRSCGRRQTYRDYDYRAVALGNPVMTSSLITRRAALLGVGGFDVSPELAFLEDWELWLRMSRLGHVRVLTTRLINYRVYRHKERDLRRVSLRAATIFAKHKALSYIDDETVDVALANYAASIGKAHLDANDKAGISYYRKALRFSPELRHKIRAFAGLCLFALPPKVRQRLIDWLYRVNGVFLEF